jgi:hypothetical protein
VPVRFVVVVGRGAAQRRAPRCNQPRGAAPCPGPRATWPEPRPRWGAHRRLATGAVLAARRSLPSTATRSRRSRRHQFQSLSLATQPTLHGPSASGRSHERRGRGPRSTPYALRGPVESLLEPRLRRLQESWPRSGSSLLRVQKRRRDRTRGARPAIARGVGRPFRTTATIPGLLDIEPVTASRTAPRMCVYS